MKSGGAGGECGRWEAERTRSLRPTGSTQGDASRFLRPQTGASPETTAAKISLPPLADRFTYANPCPSFKITTPCGIQNDHTFRYPRGAGPNSRFHLHFPL